MNFVLIRGTPGCAEIYRNKLEQCVADGKLDDEDVKNLLRLRVFLCIPQEIVDNAHAEICGRIFTKVFICGCHFSGTKLKGVFVRLLRNMSLMFS